jgi:hypothetical protein
MNTLIQIILGAMLYLCGLSLGFILGSTKENKAEDLKRG